MIKAYAKKGEKLDLKIILQEIDENVSDPMIKSFIKMELKTKFKDQKSLWHPEDVNDSFMITWNNFQYIVCQIIYLLMSRYEQIRKKLQFGFW